MQIATYHSENAKPEWSWVAYIVLPNGEYLGIMFRDASEAAVKLKAEQFWTDNYKPMAEAAIDNIINSDHHLAGKVWVKNAVNGERRRVFPSQLAELGSEWVRGGPRS